MHSLAAGRTARLDSASVRDLTPDERDAIVGGNLFAWAVWTFGVTVLAGIVDRMLFGGCTCR